MLLTHTAEIALQGYRTTSVINLSDFTLDLLLLQNIFIGL